MGEEDAEGGTQPEKEEKVEEVEKVGKGWKGWKATNVGGEEGKRRRVRGTARRG